MNYEAAIDYARQRMREIGKTPEQYHWEPVDVYGTEAERSAGLIHISAYNEIYIIINPRNYYGVNILSDNSAFDSDSPDLNGVQEFTGFISIKRNGNKWNLDPLDRQNKTQMVPIEFLRIVIY